MKLELGISVLSKRESLLGMNLETHRGVTVVDGGLCSERVVEFRIGMIFFIISLAFVTMGDKIETPDNVMKAMQAFENELEK